MSWRSEANADGLQRPGRRRHPAEDRQLLRRLTIYVAIAATGLNAALFLQAAAGWFGSGDPGSAIVSLIAGIFPGSSVAVPNTTPSPAPGATPIAVSGGS